MQRIRYDSRLSARRALANTERSAKVGHRHVGLGRLVRQEVGLAQSIDDAAGPGARPARGEGAGALTAERGGHGPCEIAVLIAQLLAAERVRQSDDGVVSPLHGLWNE